MKPSDRVKGYEVYWKKAADGDFKKPEVVRRGSSSYCILKGLEPGTPYNVKIRAFNDRYVSAFSDVEAFSTMTEQQGNIFSIMLRCILFLSTLSYPPFSYVIFL